MLDQTTEIIELAAAVARKPISSGTNVFRRTSAGFAQEPTAATQPRSERLTKKAEALIRSSAANCIELAAMSGRRGWLVLAQLRRARSRRM
jgi:hypothetical protein